jgi:quercetin dioxygenase-like cupin family protein
VEAVATKTDRELTWVCDPESGGHFALLQVDPLSGFWAVRSRFPAGTVVPIHLHSGSVTAVTLKGRWRYPELGTFSAPGDFLIERAGALHSLAVDPGDNADILFLINGSITYLNPDGLVMRIEDWITVLDEYTAGCEQLGAEPCVLGLN